MALTKIVATVGPSIERGDILTSLFEKGVSVFRFNLKYNTPEWHAILIKKIRKISQKNKKPVAILLDLPPFKKENSLRKKTEFLKKYLRVLPREEIDFFAVSFARGRKDVEFFKEKIKGFSLKTKVFAKIEAKESIQNFEEILDSAIGIMVARGDLGKEIPLEKVPYYQKRIIRRCVEVGKPVIVATQMLKSMVENPLPTRAEVSDVANSVLDYTDAVMLSEETAVGNYPLQAVSMMEKICSFWEKIRPPISWEVEIKRQTSAVVFSAYQMWRAPFCQKEKIEAFLVLTQKGLSAHMLSRLRPTIPILALTPDEELRNRLSLLFGVIPLVFEKGSNNYYKKRNLKDIKKILTFVKRKFHFKRGDKVILVYAEDWQKEGRANVIRIQEIP